MPFGQLSCQPQRPARLFQHSDPSWTADDVVRAVEAVRERLRVPFYLYDGEAIGRDFSLRAELEKVELCVARLRRETAARGRDGKPKLQDWYAEAEALFVRALIDHPWRVADAASATILVIPEFPSYTQTICQAERAMHHWHIASAVKSSPNWRARPRDHLALSLGFWHYFYPSWARSTGMDERSMEARRVVSGNTTHDIGYGRDVPSPSHGGGDRSKASSLAFQQKHPLPAAAPSNEVDLYLSRVWIETLKSAPLIRKEHGCCPYTGRREQLAHNDLHLLAPYVEPAEHAAWGVRNDSRRGRRLDFFFGGQTTARFGPGRRHLGYYVRWALMRSWANKPSAMPGALLVETDGLVDVKAMMKSNMPWPVLRRCDHGPGWRTLGIRDESGRLNKTIYRRVVPEDAHDGLPLSRASRHLRPIIEPALERWTTDEPRAPGRECTAACTRELLYESRMGGACHGSYEAARLLPDTRFALCPRGDTTTTMRTYDAIRHGAIPVFLADEIWRVGLPFQCFVPWELLSFQVPEASILNLKTAAVTLREIADGTTLAAERRMRELLARFARDVLWRTDARRVAENILLEAARTRTRQPHGGGEEACCPFTDRTDWPTGRESTDGQGKPFRGNPYDR